MTIIKSKIFIVCFVLFVWNLTITPLGALAGTGYVDDLFKEDTNEETPEEEPNTTNDLEEDNQFPNEAVTTDSSSNLTLTIVKVIFALAIVIGLIYLLLKLINGKNKMFNKVRALENLGGIALGSNKSMQAVRIGERVFVLGIGENVELLLEVTDGETKEELLAEDSVSEFKPSNFFGTLLKKREVSSDSKDQSSEKFTDLFQKELNTLIQGRKKITDRYKHKEEESNE